MRCLCVLIFGWFAAVVAGSIEAGAQVDCLARLLQLERAHSQLQGENARLLNYLNVYQAQERLLQDQSGAPSGHRPLDATETARLAEETTQDHNRIQLNNAGFLQKRSYQSGLDRNLIQPVLAKRQLGDSLAEANHSWSETDISKTEAGIFSLVGSGYCREQDCWACGHSYSIASSCAQNISDCEGLCSGLPNCQGYAFALEPTNFDEGCKALGLGRCNVYNGATNVGGVRGDSLQEYLCYTGTVQVSGCSGSMSPDSTVCGGDFRLDAKSAQLAAHLRVINGSLSLTSSPLSGVSLSVLQTIGGNLSISRNSALHAVSLPALQTLKGHLDIYNNKALTDVALPVLQTVGGTVTVQYNSALVWVSLPMLEVSGGYLVIRENSVLAGLSLPALQTLAGDLLVSFNRNVTSISLLGLHSLGGNAEINGNYKLVNVSLPRLQKIEVNLAVVANTVLAGVFLPSLHTVNGDLSVTQNFGLVVVSLPALNKVGGFVYVFNNKVLPSVSLPMLQAVGGKLHVDYNNALEAVSLPVLQTVEGYVEIYYNVALRILSLPALNNIGSFLKVSGNVDLKNVYLPNLFTLKGSVSVFNNIALTSVSLPMLHTAGGLEVETNPVLKEISVPSLLRADGIQIKNAVEIVDARMLTSVRSVFELSHFQWKPKALLFCNLNLRTVDKKSIKITTAAPCSSMINVFPTVLQSEDFCQQGRDGLFFSCFSNATLEHVITEGRQTRFNGGVATLIYFKPIKLERMEFTATDPNAWIQVSHANPAVSKLFYPDKTDDVLLNLTEPGQSITLSIQIGASDGKNQRNYTIHAVLLCNVDKPRANMWSLTEQTCTKCIPGANCTGYPGSTDANAGPAWGYFRSTNTKETTMYPCLVPDQCQGTALHCFTTTGIPLCEDRAVVACKDGYTGNLCHQCFPGFGRAGMKCVECPPVVQNQTLVAVGSSVILILVVALLVFDLYTRNHKDTTVVFSPKKLVIKIVLNAIQFNMLAVGLSFTWPSFLEDLFSVLRVFTGDAGETAVFNMDCLLRSNNGLAPKIYQTYVAFVIPIALVVVCMCTALVFGLLKQLRGGGLPWKEYILLFSNHIVVVIFLLHPMMVKAWFQIFDCASVSEEILYLVADLGVQCWTGQHSDVAAFTLTVGTFWVWIFPLVCLVLLLRHMSSITNHLEHGAKVSPRTATVLGAFKFLMAGYDPRYIWWEFVVLFRKMTMACLNVFRLRYTALHSSIPLAICTIFLIAHARFVPFREGRLDVLEFFALVNTYVTFFCGVLLSHPEYENNVSVGNVVVFSNCGFLLYAACQFVYETRLFSRGRTLIFTACSRHKSKTQQGNQNQANSSITPQRPPEPEEDSASLAGSVEPESTQKNFRGENSQLIHELTHLRTTEQQQRAQESNPLQTANALDFEETDELNATELSS